MTGILAIDFETLYDKKEYTLSKMTTEAYIRDPRFEVIGVSVMQDEQISWFSGTMEETKDWLAQFDWQNSLMLAQNTAFDAAILHWHFGIKPKGYLDTMSMANALHGINESVSLANLAKLYGLPDKGTEVHDADGKRRLDFTPAELAAYGEYCKMDVWLCRTIFDIMLQEGFPKQELKLIDLTIRMFAEPVLELDAPLLEQHLIDVREGQAESLNRLTQALGARSAEEVKDVLMSNNKFGALLKYLGVDPPMKISPTTGKEAFAFAKTDEAFTALLEHENLTVQTAVAARLGNKTTIEESRTEAFIGIASRGTFPFPLKYSGAQVSHRWSGCVVADTEILVYDYAYGVVTKRIVDVLPDDLVWDGEEFVTHAGVKFSGHREVISYGGVTATPEHVVFTTCGKEVPLVQAADAGYDLAVPRSPTEHDLAAAQTKHAITQRR